MRRGLTKSFSALLPIFNGIACRVPLSRRLLYLFCIDLHCACAGAFIAIGHIQNHNAAQMKTVAQFILSLYVCVSVFCDLCLVPAANSGGLARYVVGCQRKGCGLGARREIVCPKLVDKPT